MSKTNLKRKSDSIEEKKPKSSLKPAVVNRIKEVLRDGGIDLDNQWSTETWIVDSKTNKIIEDFKGKKEEDVVMDGDAKYVTELQDDDEGDDEASENKRIKRAIANGNYINREKIDKAWDQLEKKEDYSELKHKLKAEMDGADDKEKEEDDEEKEDDVLEASDYDQFIQLAMFGEVRYS